MRMRLPNGYGSITKMSGRRRNKWRVFAPLYVDVNNDLKDIRKTLGYFPTREEALKCLADYHANPQAFFRQNITFKKLYDMWYEQHKDKVGENTLLNYRTAYNRYTVLLDKPINEINLITLQTLINEAPGGTKKLLKNVLVMVFDYGIKTDLLTKNYAKFVEIGHIEKKIKRSSYTDDEIKVLWENSSNDLSKVLLILIYSGMRINELLNMKIENIHLDENYMVGGSKTKAGKNRVIPIHQYTKPLIVDYMNKGDDVLVKTKILETTYIDKLKKYTISLNIKHTTHDTRYTFASLMERSGVPLLTTQKIIGHSAGNLTQDLYTQIHAKELVEAVNKITVR